MEIVRRESGAVTELALAGRLDGYWAQHVSSALEEVVRQGRHRIRLDLSEVSYISSAGIRVLIQGRQELAGVDGWLAVANLSPAVRQVLEMAGLAELLAEPAAADRTVARVERKEVGGAVFEFYDGAAGGLTCRALGSPERLAEAAFGPEDSHPFDLCPDGLALGLGAFGADFESCRERFGEFLGVAGAAACQPTDSTGFPDYIAPSGSLLPHVHALYGLVCSGKFGGPVRFESGGGEPVSLSRVLDTSIPESGHFGIVMVAESAGLVGAALKRAPLGGGAMFAHPEIRRWLSFTPQREFSRSLAVIAGVASRAPGAELAPWIRRAAKESPVSAHLHAAAFGYRPLQKGRIEMQPTVRGLFETGGLKGVLHLVADEREMAGAGESEFLRGACWIAPIMEFHTEARA